MDFPGPRFGSTHPLADESTLMTPEWYRYRKDDSFNSFGDCLSRTIGNSMCTSLVSKFGSLHLPSSLFFLIILRALYLAKLLLHCCLFTHLQPL